MLTERQREAKRAYMREWRKRNPKKNKEYMERYWEKKAQELEVQKDKGD